MKQKYDLLAHKCPNKSMPLSYRAYGFLATPKVSQQFFDVPELIFLTTFLSPSNNITQSYGVVLSTLASHKSVTIEGTQPLTKSGTKE